ncbi:MAG: radical SAM family heme chaperone HemW [Deltaproteobacteria bacterium]|nr:radical SAM family heme chaperone HemW [Deltaproteobacteria bacterium]
MPPSSLNRPAGCSGVNKAGIYLHIPFCRTKCYYCAFNSHAGREAEIPAYMQALHGQIQRMGSHPWSRNRSFSSLYIGGGTPTICDSSQLTELIANSFAHFQLDAHAEITVETNPNTLSAEKLLALARAGVNRLSIGVQSFSARQLTNLGRSHTVEDVYLAFAMARSAGFSNINLDLMYGLPGQTAREWRETLETAVSLAPEHFSLYELTVEEKTPLAALIANGQCVLPTEDQVADMEEVTGELLADKGYQRYEISNYAKPGFMCRHNSNYWQNCSWLGLGAGAVGSLSGTKVSNTADPALFISRINNDEEPVSEIECLCRPAHFRETMIMGLRMLAGISVPELEKRFQLNPLHYYGKTMETLLEQDMLVLQDGWLRLSRKALPVANQVLARLV